MNQIQSQIETIKRELDKLNEDIKNADVEDKVWDYKNRKFKSERMDFEFKAYRAFTGWVMQNKIMLFVGDIDINREYIDHIGREFGFDFDKYLPR